MKRLYLLCSKLSMYKLANALAYANASKYRWEVLTYLVPKGLTSNWRQSFLNGYHSNEPLGWIRELEIPADNDGSDLAVSFKK